jgi:DNA-binding transcriptional LysR family regulator
MGMSTPSAQRLTIKQLRLIVAIADTLSLSRAAHSLAVTQPSASRGLAEIERICGGAVFQRHARGMTPTPLGELLARRARNVIEELDGAAVEMARFRSGLGGIVRIGAVTGGALGYVVPVVRQLKHEAPDVEVRVNVAASQELVRDLTSLGLDFALARIPPTADAAMFDIVRAAGEAVVVIVRAGHPAAERAEVSLVELLDYDWVMQGSGAPIRATIEEALIDRGARLPARVTSTSSLLVTIALLASSDAAAPVSREVAELLTGGTARPGIVALPLRERIVVDPYSLLSLRDRRLSPAAQKAHELVRATLQGPPSKVT